MNNLPSRTPEQRQGAKNVTKSRYQQLRSSLTSSLLYLDMASAILLAIATVATAWCAYQSTRWSGVQATSFAEASSLRIQAGSQSNQPATATHGDSATFIDSISARSGVDPGLPGYILNNLIHFGFKPILDNWSVSQGNAGSSSASGKQSTSTANAANLKTPSALSVELSQLAQLKFLQATNANQTGDDYMLATVLFASVLSFASVSTKFRRFRTQGALVGAGFVMLMIGFVQLAGLPVH